MTVFVLDLVARALAALPLPVALHLGRGLGWIFGNVVRRRRGEARAALARSFPELSDRQRTDLLARMYRNLGITVVEQLRICRLGLKDIKGRMTVIGGEHLRAVDSQKTGAISLMAHIGNWELCGYTTTLVDRPITVVVKRIRNPKVDEYVRKSRAQMDVRMLDVHKSFRACLKILRNGEFLGMVMDQNMRAENGVFVDFFGRPACTTTGLALLSAHSKTPVVPMFIVRNPDTSYNMIIGEPIDPPPDRKPETLRLYTQRYTTVIEDIVRQYPDQWIWLHRRWRTRPPEEGDTERAQEPTEAAPA